MSDWSDIQRDNRARDRLDEARHARMDRKIQNAKKIAHDERGRREKMDHDKEMYEQKRVDRVNDLIANEKHKTHLAQIQGEHAVELAKLKPRIHKSIVQIDLEDHIERENIALQSYEHQARIDQENRNQEHLNASELSRQEAFQELRHSIVDKMVTHILDAKKVDQSHAHEMEFDTHKTNNEIRKTSELQSIAPDEVAVIMQELNEGDKSPNEIRAGVMNLADIEDFIENG